VGKQDTGFLLGAFKGFKLFATAVILLIAATSCLSATEQPTMSPLSGNWMTGYPYPFQRLGIAVGVYGNRVYALANLEEDLQSECSGLFSLNGKLRDDGSFELSNERETGTPFISQKSEPVLIRGVLPAPGASDWNGSFKLVSSVGKNCSRSFEFKATRLPRIDGDYAGIVGKNQEAKILLHLEQGPFTDNPFGGDEDGADPNYSSVRGTVKIYGREDIPEIEYKVREYAGGTRLIGKQLFLSVRLDEGRSMSMGGFVLDAPQNAVSVFLMIHFVKAPKKPPLLLGWCRLQRQ
jgi:hypothetical protein